MDLNFFFFLSSVNVTRKHFSYIRECGVGRRQPFSDKMTLLGQTTHRVFYIFSKNITEHSLIPIYNKHIMSHLSFSESTLLLHFGQAKAESLAFLKTILVRGQLIVSSLLCLEVGYMTPCSSCKLGSRT